MPHATFQGFLSRFLCGDRRDQVPDLEIDARLGIKSRGAAVQQGDRLTAGTPGPCATKTLLLSLNHSIYKYALAAETGVSLLDMHADGTRKWCLATCPVRIRNGAFLASEPRVGGYSTPSTRVALRMVEMECASSAHSSL